MMNPKPTWLNYRNGRGIFFTAEYTEDTYYAAGSRALADLTQ